MKNTLLSCTHLSKKFELLDVLNEVTFTVSHGEKIGIVGPNGSGKTTLLKIIAGREPEYGGTLNIAPGLKAEYLPQVHDAHDLSGGEIAKKVLAPIVSSDAALFLLDEPTNNLDAEGLKMIESFIAKSKKAFLIVSHDRAFLDKVATKIIELNPQTKASSIFAGNYSSYLEERAARTERQWKEYADKTEHASKLSREVDRRLSQMKALEQTRKNIKKQPIHEKEKGHAAVLRDKEAKAARRAKVMKNRLERFEVASEPIEKPVRELPLHIHFVHERGSTKVFSLSGVVKSIGKKKIGPIDLTIQYGDRLHIVGKNGAGKTTLLKILLGEIAPDEGVVERGDNVRIGYVSQERWEASDDKSAVKRFMETTKLEESDARKILNRFRITAQDVAKPLSALSPGEYSRLVLAELVALAPDCIILDEPSNHLDLEALEELEEGLKEYTGTLIVVSHDRYFIEHINCNKMLDLNAKAQSRMQ